MTKTARAKTRRDEQTEAFTTCRTLRHAWEPTNVGDRHPKFGTLACLRCTRCGTERLDKFSRITGERISAPRYIHPDGYRDTEKRSMASWRASWAERLHALGLTVDA
jgi:hypothetical protein